MYVHSICNVNNLSMSTFSSDDSRSTCRPVHRCGHDNKTTAMGMQGSRHSNDKADHCTSGHGFVYTNKLSCRSMSAMHEHTSPCQQVQAEQWLQMTAQRNPDMQSEAAQNKPQGSAYRDNVGIQDPLAGRYKLEVDCMRSWP